MSVKSTLKFTLMGPCLINLVLSVSVRYTTVPPAVTWFSQLVTNNLCKLMQMVKTAEIST